MELFYCGNQWGYTPLGVTSNIPSGYCNPPTGLAATAANQYVTFKWVAPHDYESFHLEYQIGSGGWTQIVVTGTSYTIALAAYTTYHWRVRTVCNSEDSRYSTYATGPDITTTNVIPGCSPVSTVSITNMGSFYRVSWFSTGAAYYKVYVCPGALDCPFYKNVTGTFYDMVGLRVNEEYRVRVVAVCFNGLDSITSPWFPFKVVNINCLPPVNLKAISSFTSIMASWLPNPSSFLTYKYNIYLNGDLILANYPLTNFTFTQLLPNTSYLIEVRANCPDGFSTPASITVVTKPEECACLIELSVSDTTTSSATLVFSSSCNLPAEGEEYELRINNSAPIIIPLVTNEYVIEGLIPRIPYTAILRLKCINGEYATDAKVVFTLGGCGPVTNLTITQPSVINNMIACWNAAAGVDHYKLEIELDGNVISTINTTLNCYTKSNVIHGQEYTFRVFPVCIINGTPVEGAPTEQTSTYPISNCIEYEILSITWKSATSVDVNIKMTSSQTTSGTGRLIVKDDSNNIVNSLVFFSSGVQTINGLTEGVLYHFAAYDIPSGSASGNAANDPCDPLMTDYVHATCWSMAESNITATQPSSTELEIDLVNTSFTAAQTYLHVSWAYEGGSYNAPVQVNISDFPYTATVTGYGRYKVKITPYCDDMAMPDINFQYSCPTIDSVSTQVNGTTLSGKILPAVIGEHAYIITVTALGQSAKTFTSNSENFVITDLRPGLIYNGEVKMICNNDGPIYSNTVSFVFTTGTTGVGSQACAEPKFNSLVQDCSSTTPTLQCNIEPRDWLLRGLFFMPLSTDPQNSLYLEATFQINQNGSQYQELIIPGGIMGVIRDNSCLPAATVDAELEIVTGKTSVISTSATIAVNGNITGAGAYKSDGGNVLIVRVRASYLKA